MRGDIAACGTGNVSVVHVDVLTLKIPRTLAVELADEGLVERLVQRRSADLVDILMLAVDTTSLLVTIAVAWGDLGELTRRIARDARRSRREDETISVDITAPSGTQTIVEVNDDPGEGRLAIRIRTIVEELHQPQRP